MEPIMKKIAIMALVLVLIPVSGRADQALGFAPGAVRGAGGPGAAGPAVVAPEAWSRQDPADSIYRAARDAMNQGEYERASELFRRIWERHPRSTYAPDAPYWEAFTRYRLEGDRNLERALASLEIQKQRYDRASTRQNGDALALETRIRGILARRGDEASARVLVAAANEMAAAVVADPAFAEGMTQLGAVMAEEGQRLAQEMAGIAQEVAAGVGAAFGRSGAADVPEHCREQTELQLSALNALLHMNTDRALPVLKQVMERRDECAVPLRRRAVFLIAEKESPDAVELLLSAARSDPDVEVRRQAVFWLSEVDDERAVDALQEVLRESEDERVRERAVFALSQHDSPRARQLLRGVVGDRSGSMQVRRRAVFWLGAEGDDGDVEFLKSQFGRLEAPELNEQILVAVAQAERRTDAEWLLSIASNDRVERGLREKAVFWAAQSGAPAPALGSLYDRLQDRRLKERVLFGLSESDQPQAIDKLIEIARSEKDPELRKKAIFWLGNSEDPRAADVLMELISRPPPGR